VRITDSDSGESLTEPFDVTIVNDVPDLGAGIIGPVRVNEGASAAFRVEARDRGADVLVYRWDFGSGEFGPPSAASVQHVFTTIGPVTVRVQVSDDDTPTTASWIVNVENVLPTVDAGGPYVVPEGGQLSLHAVASDAALADALTYHWDLDGDGQFDDATGSDGTVDWPQLIGLGIDRPMSRGIQLRVNDAHGASVIADAEVTVRNTPAAVVVSGPLDSVEGRAVTFVGMFTDASPAAKPSYRWEVTSNTGQIFQRQIQVPVSGPIPAFTFIPEEDGVYWVTLRVGDGAEMSSERVAVTVTNAIASDVDVTSSDVARLNVPYRLTGTFVESGRDNWTGTAKFSRQADGRAVTLPLVTTALLDGSTYGFVTDYAFTNTGAYDVTITLSDGKGVPVEFTHTVTVDANAPSLTIQDVQLNEASGVTQYELKIEGPRTGPVSFTVLTRDGTAKINGGDYSPLTQVVTFAANESSKLIDVVVNNDRRREPDEAFSILVINASGVHVVRGQATATIIDDDQNAPQTSFDVNAGGRRDAMTDGVIIRRYLRSLAGGALVDGVFAIQPTAAQIAGIEASLLQLRDAGALDADGDGSTLDQTDGLLIVRYLLGLHGPALTAGLSLTGLRVMPGDLEEYLDQFTATASPASANAVASLAAPLAAVHYTQLAQSTPTETTQRETFTKIEVSSARELVPPVAQANNVARSVQSQNRVLDSEATQFVSAVESGALRSYVHGKASLASIVISVSPPTATSHVSGASAASSTHANEVFAGIAFWPFHADSINMEHQLHDKGPAIMTLNRQAKSEAVDQYFASHENGISGAESHWDISSRSRLRGHGRGDFDIDDLEAWALHHLAADDSPLQQALVAHSRPDSPRRRAYSFPTR